VVDPNVTRQLCIAVSSDRPVTTAQQVVMDVAAKFIRSAVIGGDWPDTRLIAGKKI